MIFKREATQDVFRTIDIYHYLNVPDLISDWSHLLKLMKDNLLRLERGNIIVAQKAEEQFIGVQYLPKKKYSTFFLNFTLFKEVL